MLTNTNAQAIIEYLFVVSIITISLLTMLLLSQDVLVSLYNQIWSVINSVTA